MAQLHGFEVENGRPKLKIIGKDGNAFAILAAARRAMRAAGWPQALQDIVLDDARSDDYDHLLAVMLEKFEVE